MINKCALLAVCGIFLSNVAGFAQDNNNTVYVVAKRINDASQNKVVLDNTYIEQTAAGNGAELLSYVSGVDIDTRNKFGRPTSISMLGFEPRQVRVMVDGIPFNNQLSGQVNMSIIPVENMQEVEIVKGPASSVYGSSLAGSIDFITKQPAVNRVLAGNAAAIVSEHHQKKTYGEISGKVKEMGYYLAGSYMDAAGISRQDDSLENKLFVKNSFDLTDSSAIILSWGLLKTDVNSGVLPDESYERYPNYTRYGKVMYNLNLTEDVLFDASLKFNNQDIETQYFGTADDLLPYSVVRSTDKYKGFDLKLVNNNVRDSDSFVVGADLAENKIESDYIVETKKVDTVAVYANYTLKLGKKDIVPALRYDNNSEFTDQISPSLGVTHYLPENDSFKQNVVAFNVARSFNAAPLLWKHYDLGLSFLDSNLDLKPERALVYQLNIKSLIKDKVTVALSLFYARIKDAIAVVQNEQGVYYMQNFERFVNKGAALSLECSLNDKWQISGGSAFVEVKDDISKIIVKGRGARIRHDISLKYDNQRGTKGLLTGNYAWWNQADFYNADDRKFIWDLKLSKDFLKKDNSKLTIGLNVYNITNSYYAIDDYYPHPRRYFEGMVKWFW